MSFCKTGVNKESHDGIESIYQSKIDSSLNSDSKIKEGVCNFLSQDCLRLKVPLTGGRLKFFVTEGVHVLPLNVAWFLMISCYERNRMLL